MLRQEMKGIAQKITELEAEHDEHRWVLQGKHSMAKTASQGGPLNTSVASETWRSKTELGYDLTEDLMKIEKQQGSQDRELRQMRAFGDRKRLDMSSSLPRLLRDGSLAALDQHLWNQFSLQSWTVGALVRVEEKKSSQSPSTSESHHWLFTPILPQIQ